MGLGFSTPGLRIPIGVCDSASGVEWSWSRVTESWKSGTRSNQGFAAQTMCEAKHQRRRGLLKL